MNQPIDLIPNQAERRRDTAAINALLALVEQLTERVHEVAIKVDKIESNLETLPDVREKTIATVLESALPGGDGPGHKRYHEDVMKSLEARTVFWTKMRDELAKWGLIGFMGWVLLQLWQSFLRGPQ